MTLGCNNNVTMLRVVCTKNMQIINIIPYEVLPDLTASLANSKLHLCELCSKIFDHSSEVHKYSLVHKFFVFCNFFFQLTTHVSDFKKKINDLNCFLFSFLKQISKIKK